MAALCLRRLLNTLRQGKNGRYFADEISKSIFLNKNTSFLNKIPLNFVTKGLVDNMSSLFHVSNHMPRRVWDEIPKTHSSYVFHRHWLREMERCEWKHASYDNFKWGSQFYRCVHLGVLGKTLEWRQKCVTDCQITRNSSVRQTIMINQKKSQGSELHVLSNL